MHGRDARVAELTAQRQLNQLRVDLQNAAIAVRPDGDGEASALRRSDRPKFEGVLRTTGFMALMIWIGWLATAELP